MIMTNKLASLLILFASLSSMASGFNKEEMNNNAMELRQHLMESVQNVRRRDRKTDLFKTKTAIINKLGVIEFQEGSTWCKNHPDGPAMGYASRGENVINVCPAFYNMLKLTTIATESNKNRPALIKNFILHEALHTIGEKHGPEMYFIHDQILSGTATNNIFLQNSHPDLSKEFSKNLSDGIDLIKQTAQNSYSTSFLEVTFSPEVEYSHCSVVYVEGESPIAFTNFIISRHKTPHGELLDLYVDEQNVNDILNSFPERANLIKTETNKTVNNIYDVYLRSKRDLSKLVTQDVDASGDVYNIKGYNPLYINAKHYESGYINQIRFYDDKFVSVKGSSGKNAFGICE
jgi:hypothetical protein